jgi:negative regulator of flagellin synthesis FlgM
MTIDKVGNVNNIYETKRPKNVQKAGQTDKAADSIQISSEGMKAVEDARFAQIVRETPDIREERVREIKAKIDAGTYDKEIDDKILNLVADKIIAQFIRK